MRRLFVPAFCAGVALTLVLAGCESTSRTTSTASNVESKPVQQGSWPTMSGRRELSWSSLAYPTGVASTSAVGIEKGVPHEVRLNAPFEYKIVVTNLTNMGLRDVAVTENIGEGLRINGSTPEGRAGAGGTYNWVLDTLGPKQSKVIRVDATALREGSVGSCASVTYNSLLCASIPVVQPKLMLTKSGPAEVLRCDEIEYMFVVKNTGSGSVPDVVVNDKLPDGLLTLAGDSSITFNAGTLDAGQSKQFKAKVKATRRGEFSNAATASGGGLTAESGPVRTIVREPALKITKSGPQSRFIGFDSEYQITVTNTGDGVAKDTVISDTVPAGASFVSASDGGKAAGNKVTWSIGDLAPNASKTVRLTLKREDAGTLRNEATARAYCASAVSAVASTEYTGIPAVLLEVIDISDPVQVGKNETYVITVTNQGSAADTNIAIVCTLEANQEFVSAGGATNGSAQGNRVTFSPLRSLAPGEKASWRVVVRNVKSGDVRFSVQMDTDQLTRPVNETEATNVYE